MVWSALLAIAVCLWLAFRVRRRRARAAAALAACGLPADSRTVWQDLAPDPRLPPARRLADRDTRLRGSVDHAFRTRDGRLAIGEFKACGQAPPEPRASDLVQLGALFLLCARDPSVREEPSHGVLVYRDETGESRAFRVANAPALRAQVLRTLQALRAAEGAEAVRRSHEHRSRCRGCGWASRCDEALDRPGDKNAAAERRAPHDTTSRGRAPRWIGARELAEFSYCAKSWAFRRRDGDPPDPRAQAALARGRLAHRMEGIRRADAEIAVRRGRWWWVWLVVAGALAWWAWLR